MNFDLFHNRKDELEQLSTTLTNALETLTSLSFITNENSGTIAGEIQDLTYMANKIDFILMDIRNSSQLLEQLIMDTLTHPVYQALELKQQQLLESETDTFVEAITYLKEAIDTLPKNPTRNKLIAVYKFLDEIHKETYPTEPEESQEPTEPIDPEEPAVPTDPPVEDNTAIVEIETRTEIIPQPDPIYIENNDLPFEEEIISESGHTGEKEITEEVTYVNGEEINRQIIAETILIEAVADTIQVGTKVGETEIIEENPESPIDDSEPPEEEDVPNDETDTAEETTETPEDEIEVIEEEIVPEEEQKEEEVTPEDEVSSESSK